MITRRKTFEACFQVSYIKRKQPIASVKKNKKSKAYLPAHAL